MTDTDHVSEEPMILLVVGGDQQGRARLPHLLAPGSVVVAADSGLDRLAEGILAVDHVVGDLDSVSDDALRHARDHGAEVHRHAADKDATDIELALQLILHRIVPDSGITRLLVVGPGGGRLDHLLADLSVLTASPLRAMHVTARLGPATVTIVRPGVTRTMRGRPREQVSLIPMHGGARGVTTEGLRWPLVDADLVAGTTRALSNEFLADSAVVGLDDGVLAVIQPGTTAAPIDPRSTPYDPTPRAPGGTST